MYKVQWQSNFSRSIVSFYQTIFQLQDADWEVVSTTLELHRELVSRVLAFPAGAQGLVCNGRVLGPLDSDEQFTSDDFNLLERFTMSAHVDKIYNTLSNKSEGQ